MELHLIADVIVEKEIQLTLEHKLELFWSMDMECACSSHQTESADESYHTEAVVTV